MQVRAVVAVLVEEGQVPGPNLGLVAFGLPGDEAPLHRCLGELAKGRAPTRSHHQGHAVVRQPAVDRVDQVEAGLIEEQTVRAEDHVVRILVVGLLLFETEATLGLSLG